MNRIGLGFIFISCVVAAREIDFDALEKNTNNKRSISMGFNDASKANNKKFQKINNGQRKTVNKFMSSMAGSTSNSSSSSSNYTPCHWSTGKSCYKVIEKTSSTAYKIECTRGFKAGETNKVCINSKGKWAYGCGLTDAFAYHYNSMSIAANKWCD